MSGGRTSVVLRATRLHAAVLSACVLASNVAAQRSVEAGFRRQQDAGLLAEAADLAGRVRADGVRDLRSEVDERDRTAVEGSFGHGLFAGDGHRVAGRLRQAPLPPGWHDVDLAGPGLPIDPGRAIAVRLRGGGTLVVALDTDDLESARRDMLRALAGAFAAVAAVGAAGALALARLFQARLDRIGGIAAAVASGGTSSRVPVGARPDEFDRLGAAVNAMLDRIDDLMDDLRQTAADLAHDLRKPLGRVRVALEDALDEPDPARTKALVRRAIDHGDDLASLFASLLRISEVERGGLPAPAVPLDLTALAADLFDAYEPAVQDGGRTLELRTDGTALVGADRVLVAQAVANLLDNAQLHTPPSTRIALSVASADREVRLSVVDDGPGVAAADRQRIARRSVRLEASRTAPGHRLGLNMVSAVAKALKGRLEIGDAEPGLSVTVVLPAWTGTS